MSRFQKKQWKYDLLQKPQIKQGYNENFVWKIIAAGHIRQVAI